MGQTIDDQLVGYWSSLEFSYGVMEATDVGFSPTAAGGAACTTHTT